MSLETMLYIKPSTKMGIIWKWNNSFYHEQIESLTIEDLATKQGTLYIVYLMIDDGIRSYYNRKAKIILQRGS